MNINRQALLQAEIISDQENLFLLFFLKQAVAKVNKGMKTEEEAVPTWFKSYMDRVLYSKNIILLWIFAYNSEIALEKIRETSIS